VAGKASIDVLKREETELMYSVKMQNI